MLNNPIKILFFTLLLTVFIFLLNSNFKTNKEIEILNFTTDKTTYTSYEEMKIFLVLKASKNLENVSIKIWGIKPRNYAYVDLSKTVNLMVGENKIAFTTKTPFCTSGCGGVFPGPYELYAEVFVENEKVSNSSLTINLVKG